MHLRPLIILIMLAITLLLGFNIINSNRHENNRVAAMNINSPVDTNIANANIASSSNDINNKPLGEQPKAIMDKATSQIDAAQQVEKDRLARMDGAK